MHYMYVPMFMIFIHLILVLHITMKLNFMKLNTINYFILFPISKMIIV